MAGKFYGVKKGRVPGIYTSWDTCKAQVTGFSGAIYKGFPTKAEAEKFVGISGGMEGKQQEPRMDQAQVLAECVQPDMEDVLKGKEKEAAVAYVDGSYHNGTKEFSYGAVIAYQGEEFHFSQKVDSKDLASMRNVAGEIKGAECAMQFALDHKCKKIYIYHDYEGIARWCLGEWKTNKEGTKAYRDFYLKASKETEIHFVKVKGHSNDKYNDMADELAKQALGIF
ncbi:MAG: reverse transcriptase-like protein [Clostridiales bacterium]|nr:reverse transcriptase-like protein [Clostridiales bacterium]